MSVEQHKMWACKEVQDIISRLDDQFLDNFLMSTSSAEVDAVYQELDRVGELTPHMAVSVLLCYVGADDLKRIHDTQNKKVQDKILLYQAMMTMDATNNVAGVTFSFNSEDVDLMNIAMANMNAVVFPRLEGNMRAMQVAEMFNDRAKSMFTVYMQVCDVIKDKNIAAQDVSPELLKTFLDFSDKLEKYLQPRYQDALQAQVYNTRQALDKPLQEAKERQLNLQQQNLKRVRTLSQKTKRNKFKGL